MFSMPVTRTVWRRELDFLNILIIFNISNIDKEIKNSLKMILQKIETCLSAS
jgi:hypothetical protein